MHALHRASDTPTDVAKKRRTIDAAPRAGGEPAERLKSFPTAYRRPYEHAHSGCEADASRSNLRGVSPDDIKALRKDLACTAKELAQALELEQATVLAWEKGELFPTKKYVDQMEALRKKGPAAIPKKVKGPGPMQVLTDPATWTLVRKILAHKKLRDEVTKLAATYADPAEES